MSPGIRPAYATGNLSIFTRYVNSGAVHTKVLLTLATVPKLCMATNQSAHVFSLGSKET